MTAASELQTLMDRYVVAYRAADPAACAAVFTEDAQLFSPFAPGARGRAAIETLHADWTRDAGGDKVMTVLSAEISGDMAWCLAAFCEGADETGTSLNVLVRQSDGTWLIHMCSLNV